MRSFIKASKTKGNDVCLGSRARLNKALFDNYKKAAKSSAYPTPPIGRTSNIKSTPMLVAGDLVLPSQISDKRTLESRVRFFLENVPPSSGIVVQQASKQKTEIYLVEEYPDPVIQVTQAIAVRAMSAMNSETAGEPSFKVVTYNPAPRSFARRFARTLRKSSLVERIRSSEKHNKWQVSWRDILSGGYFEPGTAISIPSLALTLKVLLSLALYVRGGSDLRYFSYNRIVLGDLIHDGYLITKGKATLALRDPRVWQYFFRFCMRYASWEQFFLKKPIAGVVGTHSCYEHGIPLRLAINNSLPSLVTVGSRIYILSSQNPNQSLEYKSATQLFLNGGTESRVMASRSLARARQTLLRGSLPPHVVTRLAPETDFASARAINETSKWVYRRRSPDKYNILVATHDFVDSPNTYGMHPFPDFWSWLRSLSSIALASEHRWFIRRHPYARPASNRFFDKFMSLNPHLTEASQNQPLHEQISNCDLIVTVYGNIGLEAAILGTPVYFCTPFHPWVDFDIGRVGKSVVEIEDYLSTYVREPVETENSTIGAAIYMTHDYWGDSLSDSRLRYFLDSTRGEWSNEIVEWLNEVETNNRRVVQELRNCIIQKDYLYPIARRITQMKTTE